MAAEPCGGQPRDDLEGPRLLEQVRRARDDASSLSQRSIAKTSWLSCNTTSSCPPTISSVGRNHAHQGVRRRGPAGHRARPRRRRRAGLRRRRPVRRRHRCSRRSTRRQPGGRLAQRMRTHRAAASSRSASRSMSKRVALSRSSLDRQKIEEQRAEAGVAQHAGDEVLRGLCRQLPLPCANATMPRDAAGRDSVPWSRTSPTGITTSVADDCVMARRGKDAAGGAARVPHQRYSTSSDSGRRCLAGGSWSR